MRSHDKKSLCTLVMPLCRYVSLSASSTYNRSLCGDIGKMDTKNVKEAQRFVDERFAGIRKVNDAVSSAQDKQQQYEDQHGCKINEV